MGITYSKDRHSNDGTTPQPKDWDIELKIGSEHVLCSICSIMQQRRTRPGKRQRRGFQFPIVNYYKKKKETEK